MLAFKNLKYFAGLEILKSEIWENFGSIFSQRISKYIKK